MILYTNDKIKEQIESDYEELEKYKNSYTKRINLYNIYLNTMQVFEVGVAEKNNLNKEELENKKQLIQTQIEKISTNLELLSRLLKNVGTTSSIGEENNIVDDYNQNYKEIRNNYINNSVFEEDVTENFINGLMQDWAKTLELMKENHAKEIEKITNEKNDNKYVLAKEENVVEEEKRVNIIDKKNEKETYIKNNNTLLISEIQGKVILPYKAEEVIKILNQEKSKYRSAEEVIEDKFTRKLANYKIQFASRYAETIKLARERENYSRIDAITIATEMMKKRLLHPAIISACRTLNELDVYLDCLDKNELEDFKIFSIKYELYPTVVKFYNRKKGKHSEMKKISIRNNTFKKTAEN